MSMSVLMNTVPAVVQSLDPEFKPAILLGRAFRDRVRSSGRIRKIRIAVFRSPKSVSTFDTTVFDEAAADEFQLNVLYVERIVKAFLWAWGGYLVQIAGDSAVTKAVAKKFSEERQFDIAMMEQIYESKFQIQDVSWNEIASETRPGKNIGCHFDGCRIGLDLGGTGLKAVGVIDGKSVFEDVIPWDPYFQKDVSYHKDILRKAYQLVSSHLPRVDAVGVSSAGVIQQNRIRLSSLFRGIPESEFESKVPNVFLDLAAEWNVPFELLNDGEVSALAGAMDLHGGGVLGVAFGTSLAGGYVTGAGTLTDRLNELAFVPIDLDEKAPEDEWSKDVGCGVQYFSAQGVERLAKKAKVALDPRDDTRTVVQKTIGALKKEDPRATAVFRTIGMEFGYGAMEYAELYPDVKTILVTGGVTSEAAGEIIIEEAQKTLREQFPEQDLTIRVPAREERRFGQALAAATLPEIKE